MYLCLTLTPSFGPLRQKIGTPLFTSIIYFADGEATWVFRPDEAQALGHRMLDVLRVPAYRSAFDHAVAATADGARAAARAVHSQLAGARTADELLELFHKLEDAFTAFYVHGAFVEPVQVAAQATLRPAVERIAEAIEIEDADVSSALYSLSDETFAAGRIRGLSGVVREICSSHPQASAVALDRPPADVLAALDDVAIGVADAIAAYAERWSWSLNNYARCLRLSPSQVVATLADYGTELGSAVEHMEAELAASVARRERLTRQKHQLLARLTPAEAVTLSLHAAIGASLLDLRKEIVMEVNGALTDLLRALAERTPFSLEDLLLMLPQELDDAVAAPEAFAERLAKRRERFLVYQADFSVLDEDAYDWGEGFEAMDGPIVAEGAAAVDALAQILNSRLDCIADGGQDVTQIVGTIVLADPEQATSTARVTVVSDPLHARLEAGDVLVTPSTTPDFLPLMRMASAIITDWGGQTSHAAITARELGKPCLIGTGYASRVLRTGQVVCIDWRTGAVGLVSESEETVA
jgi:phosphohistidine swiveling domain-containing protein